MKHLEWLELGAFGIRGLRMYGEFYTELLKVRPPFRTAQTA